MKLFLMRHGVAKQMRDDALRSLTEDGRKGVQSVADHFLQSKIDIQRIVHSELLRAIETAKIMLDTVNPSAQYEEWKNLRPQDNIDSAMTEIEAHKLQFPDQNLLLVGHLPYLYELTAALVKDSPRKESVQFGESFVACLNNEEKSDEWHLEKMIMPSPGW